MVSEVIMDTGDTKANVYTWKQSQVATSYLYYYNAVLDKQHSISSIQDYDSQLGKYKLCVVNPYALFAVFRWKTEKNCKCPHGIVAAAEGKTRCIVI